MKLILTSMLLFAALHLAHHAPKVHAGSLAVVTEDVISGDWDLTINNQGNTSKLNLVMKLDGEKITGNFESSTPLGNGPVTGKWADNKIELNVSTSHVAVTFTGTLKNGRLSGDWNTPQLDGKWEATRKKTHGDGKVH